MSGELIDVVGIYGLIEVDLMPTLGREITPNLEMWHSRLTNLVVR